jgi:hypothetical protein
MTNLQSALVDLRTGDDLQAERAVEHLTNIGEQAIPFMLEELSADDPDRRCWAIAALAGIQAPSADDALMRSLHDPDPEVQRFAVWGFYNRPRAAVLPFLAESLHVQDRLLARLAGDTLRSFGLAAIETLTTVAQSEHNGARIEATRALALMNLPATVPTLLELLEDPSPQVQFWAEEGLQRNDVGMVFLPSE